MSDSQPTETNGIQGLEFPATDLYDDDFSEDAVLLTPLEICQGTSGYLSSGGTQEEGVGPDSICEEVGETYANLIAHSRVRASLKRPLRLCKYFGAPACLMVLEIQISDTTQYRQIRRLLRFKSVDVTAEFEDADGEFEMTPEIVMFCPEAFTGNPTVVQHAISRNIGVRIGTPAGLGVEAAANMGGQHNTEFSQSCQVKILGGTVRNGDKAMIVKWQVKENTALRQGVPEHLKFVIAVRYHVQRAFTMRLNFTANLGFNDVEFRVRKKRAAMSIKIDLDKLKQQALADEHGQKHGEAWYCKEDDSELTPTTLEERTNLRGSTVGCTSDI